MPYGEKFTLSDGSTAYLSKLAEPAICVDEGNQNYQRPHFGVDVVIDGGPLDHVEIYAYQTGAGMAMRPDEITADPAQGAGKPGKWASSHGATVPDSAARRKPGKGRGGR